MANERVNFPFLVRPGAGLSRYLSALIDLVLAYVAFRSVTPDGVMRVWLVGNGVFMAAWGAVVATLLFARIDEHQALRVLRPISRGLLIGTIVSILSVVWMLMPYGSQELRLVVVVFIVGFVSVMTLSMPEMVRTVRAGIVVVCGGVIVFYAAYRGPWTIAICAFFAMFGAAMFVLSGLLPRALLDAIDMRVRAEAARDANTRFLASASHDLGQPLQAARMFFDQAMRSPPGAARDRAVKGVHWAFEAMSQLLGAIMAYMQLEAGVVEPQIENVVIGPLIVEAAEMQEPAAAAAGVSLHAMACGARVRADPVLVARMLGNLVATTIRHAKARRVLIGARRAGARVRVWVIDDGVGVAAADVERLFDEYVQGSDHGEAIRGGFGLGLATTRRLARLMGGEAGLDARWTKGSAFWFELPAA